MEFPSDFFDPPKVRTEDWPDQPELRRAVEWFKSLIEPGEWEARRLQIATGIYASSHEISDAYGDGRSFDKRDTFGWYLFLAEAMLDHIQNYDYVEGARIITIFLALGRNLDALLTMSGMTESVSYMVNKDQQQPNGCLFELLVAAAYHRTGGLVQFVPKLKGIKKTHDLDVRFGDVVWAVECKRMELRDYVIQEQNHIDKLWNALEETLTKISGSVILTVDFSVEIENVPTNYLLSKVMLFKEASEDVRWADDVSSGDIKRLDLAPLQDVLATDRVLRSSRRLFELLSGGYSPHLNYLTRLNATPSEAYPRYIEECNRAVVFQWQSLSAAALDRKARDFRNKVREANLQLPDNRPAIIHIGLETFDGNVTDKLRFERDQQVVREFDSRGKQLEYVYSHLFVPESPPDEAWAFDETSHCSPVAPKHSPPLKSPFLVLPKTAATRKGGHWQSEEGLPENPPRDALFSKIRSFFD